MPAAQVAKKEGWLENMLAYFDPRVIRQVHATLRPRKCVACGSGRTAVEARFGKVALAGAFRSSADEEQERFRLELSVCHECGATAVQERIPQEVLFGQYFYRTSASRTTAQHMAGLAWMLEEMYHPKRVLEIGSNDGILLSALAEHGVECVGFEPSSASQGARDERVKVLPEFFGEQSAGGIGTFDVVVANNVLAHVEDPSDILRGVSSILSHGGVMVFELHDLQSMIGMSQWDWVYHEHRYYYGARAVQRLLERNGMELIELESMRAHGGSVRYYASRRGERKPSKWVAEVVDDLSVARAVRGIRRLQRQMQWGAERIRGAIERRQAEGLKVAGYGASGRASMICQHSGIALDYVIDDTPGKQGMLLPGTEIRVVGPEVLAREQPDAILMLAWPYWSEIEHKLAVLGWKGELIHPMLVPF